MIRRGLILPLTLATMLAAAPACSRQGVSPSRAPSSVPPHETVFIDSLQVRTFRFFWDLCDPGTGLAPDRWPTRTFASVAATGFALSAYPIGAERGWVDRPAAARKALKTLRFLWTARQDTAAAGAVGHRGLFYHFLVPETGARFRDVELSTIDTALLLAGAQFCRSYFDGPGAVEDSLRALADSLYLRADWRWASPRPPLIGHGWSPEGGFLPWDWGRYDEASILYLLALGSPTHPPAPGAWQAWTDGYPWGAFEGYEHVGFAPLFGHQFTLCWVDLRGIRDAYMRDRGLDYFENARRAVLSQHAYAVRNQDGWIGYGDSLWGLTACDGPGEAEVVIDGRKRRFFGYAGRGASFTGIKDDGTICPSAAAASIALAPELALPALVHMREVYGATGGADENGGPGGTPAGQGIWGEYGFLDALNPTLRVPADVPYGHIDPRRGWFDVDYLGIDQGPILMMIENWRSGLIWRTMRRNPWLVRGLRAASFTGGWLDSLGAAGAAGGTEPAGERP